MLQEFQGKVDILLHNLPYITPAKIANLALNRVEIRARRLRFRSRPYILHVEPSTVCNTNCQLCPVGLNVHKEAREEFQRFMKLDDYKQIVDLYKRHLISLNIGLWGEPTLNRDILAMVQYAHQQRLHTTVLSNGHYSRKTLALAKELFSAGLDSMLISIHGMSQETFSAYQPSKKYEDVWAVIEELSAFTRSLKRRGALALAFAISNKNEHELELFKQTCDRLGMEACYYPASLNIRYLETQDQKTKRILDWQSDTYKDDLLTPYYQQVLAGSAQAPDGYPSRCWHMTSSMSVQVDGEVVVCCGAFPPHGQTFTSAGLTCGNLLESDATVEAIWNGPFFQAGRRLVLRGERIPGEKMPCYRCMDYTA